MSIKSSSSVSVVFAALTLLFSSHTASAQWSLGPMIQYITTVSTPSEVQKAGPPTRVAIGAEIERLGNNGMGFSLALSYRIENGELSTDYVAGKQAGRIQVVEPGFGAPQVLGKINSNSIEAVLGLKIPMVKLDSSGTALFLDIGFLVDRVLSAEQTDDYSKVPDYTGPETVTVNYKPQFGVGAMFGLGLQTVMGPGKLCFGLKYVFRDPTTLITDTPEAQEQSVGWLIARGMRIEAGYKFSL